MVQEIKNRAGTEKWTNWHDCARRRTDETLMKFHVTISGRWTKSPARSYIIERKARLNVSQEFWRYAISGCCCDEHARQADPSRSSNVTLAGRSGRQRDVHLADEVHGEAFGTRCFVRDSTGRTGFLYLFFFLPSPYRDAKSFFLSSSLPSAKLGIFPSAFILAIATVDAIHRVTGLIFSRRDFPRLARNNASHCLCFLASIS